MEEAELLAVSASDVDILLKEGRVEGGVEGGVNCRVPEGSEVGICMQNSMADVLPHVTISTEFERWFCYYRSLPRLSGGIPRNIGGLPLLMRRSMLEG